MSSSRPPDAPRVLDRRPPHARTQTQTLPGLFPEPFADRFAGPAQPATPEKPAAIPAGRTFIEVRRLEPDESGLDEIETIWQIFRLGVLETEVLQHDDGWASCPCAQYHKHWTCDHINLLVYLGLIVACDFVTLADPTEVS